MYIKYFNSRCLLCVKKVIDINNITIFVRDKISESLIFIIIKTITLEHLIFLASFVTHYVLW